MKFIRATIFAMLAIVTASSASAEIAYAPLIRSLTDTVIIPAYRNFADSMTVLAASTDAYCTAPSPMARRILEAAYHDGMERWEFVQPIDFGPVTANSRYSRIQFWPDKGSTAARHLRQALEKQDPALLADGGLQGRSVALQNLSAYEQIIFETLPSLPGDSPYACHLATAIARFQSKQASEILDEWLGVYAETRRTAESDAAKGKEMATAMFKSLHGVFDRIIAQKLERPLDKSLEAARPKRAESWRSERSLANIAANLRMAAHLYSAKDSFGDRLAAGGSGPLDAGLRRTFADIIAQIEAIDRPLFTAVSDAEARKKVEDVLAALKDLRILISGPVAEELDLVIGFNAMDGD